MKGLDVAKHNALIDATSTHTFSQFEQQFIAEALSRISMEDDELTETEVDVDELYLEAYGAQLEGGTKQEVYKSLEELTEKTITIHTKNERATFAWLSLFKYDKLTKKATININPDAARYLLNLTKGFTKIKRDVYMLMSNTYGTRLLEIMSKVYGVAKQREFEVNELRELLHVGDKYKSNYDFKRYVIDPAIEEVNMAADFTLTYEQVKTGRRITHIKFIKHSKKNTAPNTGKERDVEDIASMF